MPEAKLRQIQALKVRQWLPGWNKIDFDPTEYRTKPPPHFYIFSLPARELRSLSGIVRRQAKNAQPRTADLGIQRQHDPGRSEEISRFVEYGYPWSTLSKTKRLSVEFNDLRKPGWLPTAVVLNILVKGSERGGAMIENRDLAVMLDADGICTLQLPYAKWTADWSPTKLPPFEVIDGQHRLWAFDNSSQIAGFELPVVAFVGLDISWQAYLFWTINIKPKRINASLAFDLYPLLRSEDWLDRAEGHAIYRETRAQELTEILWSHPSSPWYDRINMLGERQIPWVSQSAWVKSLIATFVRPWEGRAGKAGGLFGGRSKRVGEVLGWSRAQQSAFLIFIWNIFKTAVQASTADWAEKLRQRPEKRTFKDDLAFYGPFSLIATDQGVRGYLQVVNDLCYIRATVLKLNNWIPNERAPSDPVKSVEGHLKTLEKQDFAPFLKSVGQSLAGFDWRTSSAPELEEQDRRAKLVFRGSSGYKELRTQLLEHLAKGKGEVADAAKHFVDEERT
ncbi:MAG: DGQHR domain-containing protein [Alphaproteobacteria bacterium]|nr:DGQHR domain-containing protein [Alphaproteobacteria bacterium]